MKRTVGALVATLLLAACVQPEATSTPEGVAQAQSSGNASLGFWTSVQGRDCVFAKTNLLNTQTGQEIEYLIASRYSAASTVSSRLSGRDRPMPDVVFLSVPPGTYTVKDIECTISQRTVVSHSEEAIANDPAKRLTLPVGPGEVVDFGTLKIETESRVGSNAIVVVNSRAIVVPEPSSARRLEAIGEVLGPTARLVMTKTAVRAGS